MFEFSVVMESNAKSRREKQNSVLAELCKLLPMQAAITTQMDKTTVIRLLISYLKMQSQLDKDYLHFENSVDSTEILIEPASQLLQTLDGFVMVLDSDGKVLYISEGVSVHLGFSHFTYIGNSFYSFLPEPDRAELHCILMGNAPQTTVLANRCQPYSESEVLQSFSLRMKCSTSKRNAGLIPDGHKVIHFSGYTKFKYDTMTAFDPNLANNVVNSSRIGLIAIGQPFFGLTNMSDLKICSKTFIFRSEMDLSIVYVDDRITKLTGLSKDFCLNKSLYQLIHGEDVLTLQRAHKILIAKHQSVTGYYRLAGSFGRYFWICSQFSTISLSGNLEKPKKILAINQIIT